MSITKQERSRNIYIQAYLNSDKKNTFLRTRIQTFPGELSDTWEAVYIFPFLS
jgi:hypothetical protein